MFTLEKEVETLKRWAEETYPDCALTIHIGRGIKNCEEYTLEFKGYGKHKGVTFRIPDHAEFQDPDYIKKLKEAYVEQNKRAITDLMKLLRH